jgi:hypothetical protein
VEARRTTVEVLGAVFDVQFVDSAPFGVPGVRGEPFAALDTETPLIVYDGTPLEVVTLQVCYLNARRVDIVPWYAVGDYLGEYARARAGSEHVFHNAAFDLKVLGFTGIPWLWRDFFDNRVTDTMVRVLHKCQAAGRYMPSLSLKSCAKAVLGVDLDKDSEIRLGHSRTMHYTLRHMQYGAKDGIVTAMIRHRAGGPLETPRGPEAELVALKGAIALEAIRDNGMLVDRAEYTRMRRIISANAGLHAEYLREWGVVPGRKGVKNALQRVLGKLEERYGFALPRTPKSKDRQVNDIALAQLSDSQRHPFLNTYTCFIGARQLLSHFFHDDLESPGLAAPAQDAEESEEIEDGGAEEAKAEAEAAEDESCIIHPDGRIHPRFSWTTDTGRTNCSGPNAQNFPRRGELWTDPMSDKPAVKLGIRGYIVPTPGHCINSIDFNQVELCGLAEDCMCRFGYSRMAELINDGVDLHTWFAEQVAVARRFDWEAMKKADRKNLRQMAKVANFGTWNA